MANLINKAKDALSGNKHHDGVTGTTTTTHHSSGYDNPASSNYGPHSTNVMNTMDPQVQSSGVGHHGPTHATGAALPTTAETFGRNEVSAAGPPHHHHDHHNHGQAAMVGTGYDNTGPTHHHNAGHHTTGTHNQGVSGAVYDATHPTHHTTGHHTTGAHTTGVTTGTHNQGVSGAVYDATHPTHHNNQHHNQGISGAAYDATHPTTHHTHGTHGTHGHGMNTSGYDNTIAPGSGNVVNPGPVHNSAVLNKLDPRVDSKVANNEVAGNVRY